MPDIRSFFAPKGDALPPKPALKDGTTIKTKGPGRPKMQKVIDDSDDDVEMVEVTSTAKVTSTNNAMSKLISGVETNTSEYFGSSKSKQDTTTQSATNFKALPGPEVRAGSSIKKHASRENVAPPKAAQNFRKKGTNYRRYEKHGDENAYIEDDKDAGDNIYAADAGAGNKRKNDEYVDEEIEEEFLLKPKRTASRAKAAVKNDFDSDILELSCKKSAKEAAKDNRSSVASRKRKSPTADDDEEEAANEAKPRKKAALAKPRVSRVKKHTDLAESKEVQDILDNIPTVDAPDAPPKDPDVKFDWRRKAGDGGNSSAPAPMETAEDEPEGEENCLLGKSFVFTGVLQTMSRDRAQALVKRYGGKITGVPSKSTDFVVLGDDAGPSKLRKIQTHGIRTIDEVGLRYLIEKMPANGGTGQGAAKAQEKREKEEKEARELAEKMEHDEREQRKADKEAAEMAAKARGFGTVQASAQPLTQLWTTKYAPTQLGQICGNKGHVAKLQNWLKNWPKSRKYKFQKRGADGMGGYRAILISGPPGIGKTTAAHLAAKLAGYDVLESNASDTRSKRLVETGVTDVVDNTSLLGYYAGDGKKAEMNKKDIVLIMDEVDGMSAGDRGGVGALAKLCKKTDVPMILICNDRGLPKMKPFEFVTFDMKFQRPTVDMIRGRIMTICHREGLKLPPAVVNSLIEGSNRDIRQIINMLATIKLDQAAVDFDKSKAMSKSWEKHIILKPWDICQKIVSGGLFGPASTATLNDKIELYFNDHDFSFLMIQENYLRAKPAALNEVRYQSTRQQTLRHLELVEQAAESISDGDLVDRMIHGPQQHWSLMPAHAVFSTVRPASFIAGQLVGSCFTTWLGNNSKYQKLSRFVREIHAHMRLRASGDHNEVRQQYLPVLWHQLIRRLEVDGKDCVPEVIKLMDSYYLTRDDWDEILELGVGHQADSTVQLETQTKSAFTRLYNQASHPVPFIKQSALGPAARKVGTKDVPDLEEAIEEEDDGELLPETAGVDEADVDITKDKYIKAAKKPKKIKAEAEEEDKVSKPAAGGMKGKGRGRLAKK